MVVGAAGPRNTMQTHKKRERKVENKTPRRRGGLWGAGRGHEQALRLFLRF